MSEQGDAARRRASLRRAGLIGDFAVAILFFCVLTPLALALRFCGRNRLELRLDPATPSYWIARDPARGRQTAMTKQY
jgi:hypothetical protein